MSSINLGPKIITEDLLFCLDGGASVPAIKSPKQISNCVRWFDADDPSMIVTESGGTAVRYWYDKSDIGSSLEGGGLTLAKQPNIVANGMNNRTVMRFDGGDYFLGGFATAYSEFTFIFVMNGNPNPTNYQYPVNINSGSFVAGSIAFDVNDPDGANFAQTMWVYWNGSGGNRLTVPRTSPNTNSDLVQGSPTIVSFTHIGSANILYLNGRIPYSSSISGTQTATIGGAGLNLLIGASSTTLNGPYKGDIAEVIIYSKALSQKERRSVEGYLSQKWNIPLVLDLTEAPLEDLSSNTEINNIVYNTAGTYPNLISYYKKGISLNTGSGNNYFTATKPSNIDYLGTAYTIEWCGALYARRNTGTNYAIITTEGYPSSGLVLRVDGGSRVMYHRSNFITANAGSDNAGGEILPGIYYHYMIVFDNGRLQFYRDGVLTTDYTSGQFIPGSNGASLFYVLGDTQTCEGETLTLKLHRRAFTGTEVSNQYNLMKPRIDAVPNKMVTSNIALWIDFNYSSTYPNGGTSIFDLTGNAYNWTRVNSPTFFSTDPKCMNFDGSDDHWILTADIASPSTGAGISLPSANNWSWTFWFKTSAGGTFLSHAGSGPVYCAFRVTGSYLNYYHYSGGWISDSATTTNVSDGLWHCATYVNSANTMIIYLDGNVEKTSFASNVGYALNPVNMMGAFVYSDYFNGKMGHVIYHTTNLSASQVKQVYDATKYRYGK
jgi:hypothetical protein